MQQDTRNGWGGFEGARFHSFSEKTSSRGETVAREREREDSPLKGHIKREYDTESEAKKRGGRR
jgi:hypothetical protein